MRLQLAARDGVRGPEVAQQAQRAVARDLPDAEEAQDVVYPVRVEVPAQRSASAPSPIRHSFTIRQSRLATWLPESVSCCMHRSPETSASKLHIQQRAENLQNESQPDAPFSCSSKSQHPDKCKRPGSGERRSCRSMSSGTSSCRVRMMLGGKGRGAEKRTARAR